ncbi:hypothetical protein [Halobaculum sp. MBLA0143]|uniref:hypothetical protein n=1 Tax=Halobaculum sp. MBLA0143 TaxID=3079933 RepID=UPI003523EC96
MTARRISELIEPSDEIRDESGGITTADLLDEVNLYNVYDDTASPERDARRILGITYPTRTLERIVEKTAEKFDPSSNVTDGAHVVGGEYGSGKSHVELAVYHLLDAPAAARDWLDEHGIDATLPSDTRTAALQMLNLDTDYERLDTTVADYLGLDELDVDGDPPGAREIRDAVGDRPTAIFVDEFERWFGMSSRVDYTADNLAFLQNLLEAAGREDTPLTVYVSLLFEEPEVTDVLPRTNPFRHDLSQSRDEKIRFILHRLVGEVTDPEGLTALAEEYTDVYRNNKQVELSDYQEMESRVERYYPFHPTTLDTLMDKFAEQQGNQDARGLLELLTKLLADCYHETDLILTGDVDVVGFSGWFRFVDGELVGKYLNDYHRLGEPAGDGEDRTFDEYVEELLNTVLLHSLARGGEEGANRHRMLMGTLRKGGNAHKIVQTFKNRVYGHAWHVFRINGEYAFDTDENPAARIEKKAEDVHRDDAIHRVERLVSEELFDGQNDVFVLDPVNTEQDVPDTKRLKLVVSLSAHRSYDEQFEALTTGQEREYSNTIVLVTPESGGSVDTNTGIRELARKVVAGEELLRQERRALPEGFEDVHEQNHQNLLDRVSDKYGEVHVPTERGLFPQELSSDGDYYEAVREVVAPGRSELEGAVIENVEHEQGGVQYRFLRNDFYRSETLPTLTDESDLEDAIDRLCREERIKVGNYFGESVGSLGSETTIVHEQYVDDPDDGGGETITIDTTTPSESGGGSTSTGGGSGGTVGVSGGSPEQTAFECPQCGDRLDGTTCACGFEFDVTDLEDGTVEVEDGDVDELLDGLGGADGTDDEQTLERVPAYGRLEATDLPTLIDTLEREVSVSAEVHRAEVGYSGTLSAAAVETRGLGTDGVVDTVETDETLDIEFGEPVARDRLFNEVLLGLSTPEDATFEVTLEVER